MVYVAAKLVRSKVLPYLGKVYYIVNNCILQAICDKQIKTTAKNGSFVEFCIQFCSLVRRLLAIGHYFVKLTVGEEVHDVGNQQIVAIAVQHNVSYVVIDVAFGI